MSDPFWDSGSGWLRWEPHIHMPGTLLNDQFENDWDSYIKRIEETRPAVSALGITDYFTLRGYKEVIRRRGMGALRSVPLLFPNIELRLTIETEERKGINLHLLVSPDDPDHVRRMEERLALLQFRYRGDNYSCTDDGLRRLGRAHRGTPDLPDEAAIREGANQFKVELSDLRKLFDGDEWVRNNVLVAVAAGKDGLAGIAKDASFRAQREELGRFAQIVFSGNPSDRAFWLNTEELAEIGQNAKPCLHGSDAHALEAMLTPALDRRCWVRGAPTFDGLRQALVEPARRVHIGEAPPAGADQGDVMRSLHIRNADWVLTQDMSLNEGLVTIIGAKGSGKTALVDLIASAADAHETEPGPASFLAKAGSLLNGLTAELEWGDDSQSAVTLPSEPWEETDPRVHYLSQQFVDRLCAPEGLAEPLVREIERVVFAEISEEDRLQCSTFAELRDVVLEDPLANCDAEREAIQTRTQLIAEALKFSKSLPALKAKVQCAERLRKSLVKELAAIPVKVSDEKAKAHQVVSENLHRLKAAVAAEERRLQELKDLAADVRRQLGVAETTFLNMKARHPDLLDQDTWELLRLRVPDEALVALAALERKMESNVKELREQGLAEQVATGSAKRQAGLAALSAEAEKLTRALGLDQAKAKRRVELEARLTIARANEEKAKRELASAEATSSNRKALQTDRLKHYERVFGALIAEEDALKRLYAPLDARVTEDPRLSKLSFVVRRIVDLDVWANRGEALLDLRRPPFSGHGLLAEAAREVLVPAWKAGRPEDVRLAMEGFLAKYANRALEALAQGSTNTEFGEWLFSTEHISVRYGIKYEGVEIAHLSPGMRGVVLLTLYLALDREDRRPLIIDQPEENLDPRSVYADLVPFFRDAALRRQIVMVTHNANLVVNTDSDQVIVSEAQRTSPTELPQVRYIAGGLENPEIRSQICKLLEGGEDAFRKRGRRYGVRV